MTHKSGRVEMQDPRKLARVRDIQRIYGRVAEEGDLELTESTRAVYHLLHDLHHHHPDKGELLSGLGNVLDRQVDISELTSLNVFNLRAELIDVLNVSDEHYHLLDIAHTVETYMHELSGNPQRASSYQDPNSHPHINGGANQYRADRRHT